MCKNKTAATEMLRELLLAGEKKAAGIIDFDELAQQPLGELLDRYRNHLLAKDNTEDYVEQTTRKIERVFDGCRFLMVGDLDSETVATWLYEQRKVEQQDPYNIKGLASSYREFANAFGVQERTVTYWKKKGAPIAPRSKTNLAEVSSWYNQWTSRSMGAGTSNHYVTALRGFDRWLKKHAKVTVGNPFESLDKIDARADVRKSRRVLDPVEFQHFVQSARANDRKFRGLTGLAAYTGLRASEIRSLTVKSFDFDSQCKTVLVKAAYTKNRKLAKIPLGQELADLLQGYFNSRNLADDSVWAGTWNEDGAKMIRIDLAAADLPYTNDHGEDYDFHALRHQFNTNLVKAGFHLRWRKSLLATRSRN